MEEIAKKKVIIFTPNGFNPQEASNDNPYQKHKSGWTTDEMKSFGYEVIGLNGLKYLRGEKAKFRYKPELLWTIISVLTQIITKNVPQLSFHLFCIKNFKKT